MNYDNKKVDVEIPDNNLFAIYIAVISGDEIAIAVYDNGAQLIYDSATLLNIPRIQDFYDGKNCLYNALWDNDYQVNKMNTFNNRQHSYDWC